MLFFNDYLSSKIDKTEENNKRHNTNVLAVAEDIEEETSMEKIREYNETLKREFRFLKRLKSQMKKQTISDAELIKGICFFFEVNYDKASKNDKDDVSKKIQNISKCAGEFVDKYPDFTVKIKDEFIKERDYDIELFENRYNDKIEKTEIKLAKMYKEFLNMRSEINENSEFYDELFDKYYNHNNFEKL